MLYRVIKNTIALGSVTGLEEKLDVFLAAGKLTMDEYTHLLALMREMISAQSSPHIPTA